MQKRYIISIVRKLRGWQRCPALQILYIFDLLVLTTFDSFVSLLVAIISLFHERLNRGRPFSWRDLWTLVLPPFDTEQRDICFASSSSLRRFWNKQRVSYVCPMVRFSGNVDWVNFTRDSPSVDSHDLYMSIGQREDSFIRSARHFPGSGLIFSE